VALPLQHEPARHVLAAVWRGDVVFEAASQDQRSSFHGRDELLDFGRVRAELFGKLVEIGFSEIDEA